MGIGLAFVFYLAHTRFWVVPIRDANGGPALWVGGTSNRNREAFQENFKQLVEEIETKLKAESEALSRLHMLSVAGN
jgi:cytochrome c biogenesis protein ResB